MPCRKNLAHLTNAEKNAFVQAVKALKGSGVYDNFVRIHRDTMCRWMEIGLPADAGHMNSAFLPWHRGYLRRFERELQNIDPSVTIPYWDYTIDNSPTSSLWDNNLMGGDGDGPGNEVSTGLFAFSTGEWPLNVMCFPSDDGMNQPLKHAFGGYCYPAYR